MPEIDEIRILLRRELLEYLLADGFTVLAAKDTDGYVEPVPEHNDGYGDQADKSPDVLAYDPREKRRIFGIVRTGVNDLESEGSLTEYNVFLDQTDKMTGDPCRLYIIIPPSKIQDLTALMTHYIHRDYWFKIVLVSSTRING